MKSSFFLFLFLFLGTSAFADVFKFKDGRELDARLKDSDPPYVWLETAAYPFHDFPVRIYEGFEYDVASTKHPKKYISLEFKKSKDLLEKGNSFFFRKDYDNAIYYYEMALEQNPQYVYAVHNLGVAYYVIADFQKAIKHFTALKSMVDSGTPDAFIAIIYCRLENYAAAYDFFVKALEYSDINSQRDLKKRLEYLKEHTNNLRYRLR